MNNSTSLGPRHRSETSSEAGFMLVYVILLAALILIALAAAAPVIAKDLQREKELESEHRADQYVRAIRLYYRKNKTYPPSIDALENTNNVRYLRQRYIDPLTGKDDWRIIHVGENKTTVKGFFGQPLGGLNTSGAGGGLGSATGMMSSPIGSTGSTTVSGGSALSAGFAGATIGGSATGAGANGIAGATGIAGSAGSSSTSSSSGSGGIGQIMGVGTSKTGDSILDPNEQATYETWEFLYDPKIELMYQQSNILGGAPGGGLNSQSATSFGSDAVSGQSNSQGGTNSNTPSAPKTPQ